MTPTALSQALEAVAKLGLGLALCMWVLRNPDVVCRRVPPEVPLSALAAAGAVLGVTLSTVLGWVYFLLHGLRRDTRLPHDDRPAAPVSQIFRRLLYVMIPVALGSLVTNLTSLLDLVTMMRWLGRVQMLHGAELAGGSGHLHLQPDFPAFVYDSFTGHGDHCVQSGALCDQYAGKSVLPCAAHCGRSRTDLQRHMSLCHRSRGGDGVSGGRRAVGAGGAGDASALRRQTGRSCHCRRSPPDTAPRHGLPVPDISPVHFYRV